MSLRPLQIDTTGRKIRVLIPLPRRQKFGPLQGFKAARGEPLSGWPGHSVYRVSITRTNICTFGLLVPAASDDVVSCVVLNLVTVQQTLWGSSAPGPPR